METGFAGQYSRLRIQIQSDLMPKLRNTSVRYTLTVLTKFVSIDIEMHSNLRSTFHLNIDGDVVAIVKVQVERGANIHLDVTVQM